MRSTITAAVFAVLTVLVLAGCHLGSSSAKSGAHASVLATNTSAQYAKTQAEQVFRKCMPAQTAPAQLEWLRNVTAGKNSSHYQQGVTARHAFETCAGVNPANDATFKNQVENQGLAVLKTYVHDEAIGNKTGARAVIRNFVTNQVEQDAVADR